MPVPTREQVTEKVAESLEQEGTALIQLAILLRLKVVDKKEADETIEACQEKLAWLQKEYFRH